MATDDWIDLPKGAAVGSSLAAFALLVAGAGNIQDGQWTGWLMVLGGTAMVPLAWRLMANYIRGGRSDNVGPVPGVNEPSYADPPSNVKRMDGRDSGTTV